MDIPETHGRFAGDQAFLPWKSPGALPFPVLECLVRILACKEETSIPAHDEMCSVN